MGTNAIVARAVEVPATPRMPAYLGWSQGRYVYGDGYPDCVVPALLAAYDGSADALCARLEQGHWNALTADRTDPLPAMTRRHLEAGGYEDPGLGWVYTDCDARPARFGDAYADYTYVISELGIHWGGSGASAGFVPWPE